MSTGKAVRRSVRNSLLGMLPATLLSVLLASTAWAFGIGGINLDVDKIVSAGKNLSEVSRDIGEAEEIVIGESMASVLLGAAPLVRNEALQKYVNQVGRYLTLQTERPNLPWRFGVLNSNSINAFAAPGGHIVITQGLLQRLHNEAELAGVLAHEIAHVLQKHHLAALKKAGGMGFLAEVGSYAVDRKSGGSSLGKEFGKNMISGAKEVLVRGLDKSDEYEADRMGVVIATRAGYDPYGLPAVLQTLEGASTNSELALLFSTHPPAASRLDTLAGLMQNRLDPYQGKSVSERFNRLVPGGGKN